MKYKWANRRCARNNTFNGNNCPSSTFTFKPQQPAGLFYRDFLRSVGRETTVFNPLKTAYEEQKDSLKRALPFSRRYCFALCPYPRNTYRVTNETGPVRSRRAAYFIISRSRYLSHYASPALSLRAVSHAYRRSNVVTLCVPNYKRHIILQSFVSPCLLVLIRVCFKRTPTPSFTAIQRINTRSSILVTAIISVSNRHYTSCGISITCDILRKRFMRSLKN